MYKVKNNLVPEYLQSTAQITSVHSYNTRAAGRGDLYTSGANLKYFTRSFNYEGARLWNDMSISIRSAPSIAAFKQRYLKNYFTS